MRSTSIRKTMMGITFTWRGSFRAGIKEQEILLLHDLNQETQQQLTKFRTIFATPDTGPEFRFRNAQEAINASLKTTISLGSIDNNGLTPSSFTFMLEPRRLNLAEPVRPNLPVCSDLSGSSS